MPSDGGGGSGVAVIAAAVIIILVAAAVIGIFHIHRDSLSDVVAVIVYRRRNGLSNDPRLLFKKDTPLPISGR